MITEIEPTDKGVDLQQLIAEVLLSKTVLSGNRIREVSEIISQAVKDVYEKK